MKTFISTSLIFACLAFSAAQAEVGASSSFSCLDKESFEINASCMSSKIENSDSFLQSQTLLFLQSANTEHAMATLTIEPKTLNIEVLAHKDAYFAKRLEEKK